MREEQAEKIKIRGEQAARTKMSFTIFLFIKFNFL
jgi:hypothetical protein